MKIMSANRIAPDGTTASHLGLFCLPMSYKKDVRLIWVKVLYYEAINVHLKSSAVCSKTGTQVTYETGELNLLTGNRSLMKDHSSQLSYFHPYKPRYKQTE